MLFFVIKCEIFRNLFFSSSALPKQLSDRVAFHPSCLSIISITDVSGVRSFLLYQLYQHVPILAKATIRDKSSWRTCWKGAFHEQFHSFPIWSCFNGVNPPPPPPPPPPPRNQCCLQEKKGLMGLNTTLRVWGYIEGRGNFISTLLSLIVTVTKIKANRKQRNLLNEK